MTKERKIKIFILIIIIGFIVSALYHYILGNYFHKGIPYNSFLFLTNDQFMDFVNVYKSKSSVYFPFGNLIINLFCLIKPLNLSLLIFQLLSIIPVFFFFLIYLRGRDKLDSITNSIIFCFFTFPILFLIDRANFESFVFIFLFLFIYLYQRGKTNYAIIPLSFAIAMKLFPAVFFVLLFSDRKYKQIIWTIILVSILTFFSSFLLYGSIFEYFSKLGYDTDFYQKVYVIGNGGLDFGHSLFGLIKGIAHFINSGFDISVLLKPYAILALSMFFFISIYVILLEKSLWKKIALLVFSMCLFPYVSADYKLTYVLIPIFLFINTNDIDNLSVSIFKRKYIFNEVYIQYIYILLFGLLIIPKNYRIFVDIYDGVYLDPILMMMLSFLILYSGITKIKLRRQEISNKLRFLMFQDQKNT